MNPYNLFMYTFVFAAIVVLVVWLIIPKKDK